MGVFSYFNRDAKNVRNKPEWGGGGLMDIGCYRLPRRVLCLARSRCELLEWWSGIRSLAPTGWLLRFWNLELGRRCSRAARRWCLTSACNFLGRRAGSRSRFPSMRRRTRPREFLWMMEEMWEAAGLRVRRFPLVISTRYRAMVFARRFGGWPGAGAVGRCNRQHGGD